MNDKCHARCSDEAAAGHMRKLNSIGCMAWRLSGNWEWRHVPVRVWKQRRLEHIVTTKWYSEKHIYIKFA